MSEERIFDFSCGLFEDRRFLTASARGEPESRLWRVFANGAGRNVRAPNCWKAGVRFPSHRRSRLVKMPRLAVRRFSPSSAAAPPGLGTEAWIPALCARFQVRRRRISTDSRACAEFSPDSENARSGRNDGARKCRSGLADVKNRPVLRN